MPRICVYCGSSSGNSPIFQEGAAELGRAIAEQGLSLVYGGGNVGLMGVVADSVLLNGGEVIGIIPHSLNDRELGHKGLTELIAVDTMHQRKQQMADLADAFVALPGGIGTMEEFFEAFTWLQLRFHAKPVAILNTDGYYDDLIRFLDRMVSSGFINATALGLLVVDTSPKSLLKRVCQRIG